MIFIKSTYLNVGAFNIVLKYKGIMGNNNSYIVRILNLIT